MMPRKVRDHAPRPTDHPAGGARRCPAVPAMLLAWLLIAPTSAAGPAQQALVASGSLEIRWDPNTRDLVITDRQLGCILQSGVVRLRRGKEVMSSQSPEAGVEISADADQKQLLLRFADGTSARIRIADQQHIEIATEGETGGTAHWLGRAAMGPGPMVALLKGQKSEDGAVLVTTLGPAALPTAQALFDPQRDLAVVADSQGEVHWQYEDDGWQLSASAPVGKRLLVLEIHRHYYRSDLGIEYYAAIRKPSRWPTAPVVAMTWYGIEGSSRISGRYVQEKEWLYPNIDWVANHLLPYAGPNLVFQLDDNYREHDDRYMRELSDYIRSKGLVPGIWFTPYAVAPRSAYQEHPDWFLHDQAGKTLMSFAGVNFDWPEEPSGGRAGTLNVTNPQAAEQEFAAWWHKTSETWNFDFFKIDGLPSTIRAYENATNGGGMEGFRKGLEIGRRIVGPEKFINGCSGIALAGIGPLNGARTGPDTGPWPHACEIIIRWNFLNNVAWFCDPDAAANQHRSTPQRVRLNAVARVLTGQQFLTDDVWIKVPSDVRRVWQRSFPTLDVRPVNLYQIEDWDRYDLFDLRIAKPWGNWDVVGLFNFGGEPLEKELDLGRLPLTADRVHVYDFWDRAYLGLFRCGQSVPVHVDGGDAKLFSIVPARDDRPVLISTDRHLSQGGLELQELHWRPSGEGWTVSGRSSHLVAGDPYELVFVPGRYEAQQARSSAGPVKLSRNGGVVRAQITPERSGDADWQVDFKPCDGAAIDLVAPIADVRPDADGNARIVSRGSKAVQWRARTSDPRVRVEPASGRLGPWPDRSGLRVIGDAERLGPNDVTEAELIAEAEGSFAPPQKVAVRVRPPYPPANLALLADARASSAVRNYEPQRINDGFSITRWSAKDAAKDTWVELRWVQPVHIQRVVIDECTNTGYTLTESLYADIPPAEKADPAGRRIGQWRLEAAFGETFDVVARGQRVGRWLEVRLSKPVDAARLRLTIETAVDIPSIWEMKVYGAVRTYLAPEKSSND